MRWPSRDEATRQHAHPTRSWWLIRAGEKCQSRARERPSPWLSKCHFVLVRSMRTCDVEDHKTRSDAVFGTMALDLLGKQIDQRSLGLTDVVSLIEMSDDAVIVLEREPVTNVLFNKLLQRKKECKPRSHGYYVPALKKAANVMAADRDNPSCALLLVFLSDGKPSDIHSPIQDQVRDLAKAFGSQLTVGTIGFGGGKGGEFQVLKSMAEAANESGAYGLFSDSGKSTSSLSSAISSLGSRLSAARTRITAMTAIAGSREGRTQRPQRRVQRQAAALFAEHANAALTKSINDVDWWLYSGDSMRTRWEWRGRSQGWVETPLPLSPEEETVGVALCDFELGRGAERVVYELRHFVTSQEGIISPVGERLVAKESVFAEDDDLEKNFHYVFCKTQQQAGRFARKFNARVAQVNIKQNSSSHCMLFLSDTSSSLVSQAFSQRRWLVTATITFLPCSVYELKNAVNGDAEWMLLVEKMLDRKKWTKWNSNDGHVHGQQQQQQDGERNIEDTHNENAAVAFCLPPITTITVGSDSEDEGDGFEAPLPKGITPATTFTVSPIPASDFPQAFSHYTHRYSQRKSLVCDLQGTLDSSVSPALFELTDPVIHHASSRNRQRVYGRTDHGSKGISAFFRSHTCNALCKILGLPADR